MSDDETLDNSVVSDLTAECIGHDLLVSAQVVSIDGPMALPMRIKSTCMRCGETAYCDVDPDTLTMLDRKERKSQLQYEGLNALMSEGRCRHTKTANAVNVEELVSVDYYTLFVSDPASKSKFSKLGNDPRLLVHLIGPTPPITNEVVLNARVVANPLTRALELVCHDYSELETAPMPPKLTGELIEQFREIGSMNIDALRLQIAPDMIGRSLPQRSRLLVLCSPLRIPDVDGKEIRGCLTEVLLGDTTTHKSESVKDTAERQGFGPVIQAENASRTGVTFSLTQKPNGGWSLVWGLLPRYHGTYAAIDGLEMWPSERQQQLRGVLRDGYVEVDKVVHGRRRAAVRTTITANPEKPMKAYPMKCMAIPDCRPFKKGPDIARIDIWLPFSVADVTPEQLGNRIIAPRPIGDEIFRSFVYWAWSRSPDDIEYLVEAKHEIKAQSAMLMAEFGSSSLPIVTSGFRDTLCRVSVAFAVLGFSTSDGTRVSVNKEHVAKAVAFFREMYESIELKDYVTAESNGLNLSGKDAISTAIGIGEGGISVIAQLVVADGPLSSTVMSERSGMTADTIQHTFTNLKEHSLVETKRGKGAELTYKGVAFVRWLRSQNALLSQKLATSQSLVAEVSDNNQSAEAPQ